MKTSAITIVLVAAATVLLLSTVASAAKTQSSWWAYTHVHVINEFSGGQQLTVHCKSKDDDMGSHSVAASSEYEWRFRPSIFGNTLFWCHVLKGDKEIVYDAYWEEKNYDRKYMDHVRWVTKDDGLYLRQFWKGVDVFWLPWP